MRRNPGKKAGIHFSDMEKEYQKKYGIMPDYHHTELYQKYGAETAGRTVQENMDAVWREMRERNSPMFTDCSDSPFSPITGQGGAE